MAQFDVYANPITAARNAYPWVVGLQSELASAGPDRIVAPLVPRESYPPMTGRLTPLVRVQARGYVLLIPGLAGVAARDLSEPVASLIGSRIEILAAIDYLFFGV
jgi:toxin CcdB